MKKIITVLLLISIRLSAVTIDGKNISVPTNYNRLKEKYILAVQMYYAESDSHRKTLTKLTNQIAETKKANADLKQALQLIKELQKTHIDFFNHYLIFYGGYDFDSGSSAVGVGWQGLFLERILLGIETKFPAYAGLMFGVKL